MANLVLVGAPAALSRQELYELTRVNHHPAVAAEMASLGHRRQMTCDRMFTARRTGDGDNRCDEAIIHSSTDLEHSLGLRVVAEGVERSDCFAFVATVDCDVAQSYAISFPNHQINWTCQPSMTVQLR